MIQEPANKLENSPKTWVVRWSEPHFGRLYHYGHFLLDFFLPFLEQGFDYYEEVTIFLPNNDKKQLGLNIKHFKEIFPFITVKYGCPNYVASLNLQGFLSTSRSLRSALNPLNEIECIDRLLRHLCSNGELTTQPSYPSIILGQRSRLELPANLELRHNGTDRRVIKNIGEVKKRLKDYYGDEFTTLVLEKMDFKLQMEYFSHCRVLVDIMGSSLLNAIFMPNSGLIITNSADEYLSRVCRLRSHQLVTCTDQSFEYRGRTSWQVDIKQILAIIDDWMKREK